MNPLLSSAVSAPARRRPACAPVLFHRHATPAGQVLLLSDGRMLTGLHFVNGKHVPAVQPAWVESAAPFSEARRQLDAWFARRRRDFDLPIAPQGTAFQQSVWQALREIPWGETWSYARLAARLGQPSAVRAVAAANGRNPLALIIPCHRVIGSDGSLTGYAGGLAVKQHLLQLEGVTLV
jgi:methylated-DNA-[protein]-cysteine S-methyltransferase